MWLETKCVREDLEYIINADCIDWEQFRHKRFFITGATGLIGYTVICALVYANIKLGLDITIYALVRNLQRAEEKFKEIRKEEQSNLHLVAGAVEDRIELKSDIDFIVHGACPTTSRFFVEQPVETNKTSVEGTIHILDMAVEKKVKRVVYLSSMEAYGKVRSEQALKEEMLGYINPLTVRNCYPESKRMAEALCAAYASEYGLSVVSLRLAQTFGPGVAYNDNRVFAMMARCVMEHKDICLNTKGTSKHAYLYSAQAVTAILCVLLRGESGQTYNVSNPDTYCSIYEMGELLVERFGEKTMRITIPEEEDQTQYPDASFWNLDITAISELGWKPDGNLIRMYERLMEAMRDGQNGE
jgi:nucleoside-diphosphate-sugar epimerase